MTMQAQPAQPPARLTRELFRAGADVIPVRTINGQLHLLVATMRYGLFRGKRGTIGGHMEAHETLAETAVRELAEESGLAAAPADLIPLTILDAVDRDTRGGIRGIGQVYLVDADRIPGEPVAGDDVVEVEWVPLDELIALLLAGTEDFARDAASTFTIACLYLTAPGNWPPPERTGTEPSPLEQLAARGGHRG